MEACPTAIPVCRALTEWPVLVILGVLILFGAIYWWWDGRYGPAMSANIEDRIRELNEKATQILVFLSFAMVAAVTLRTTVSLGCSQTLAVTYAMRWWTGAIFPVILCVLPVKDLFNNKPLWYPRVRRVKVILLGFAIGCILVGTWKFLWAL